MYTTFASVYDRLMDQVDYAGWAQHYHQLMQGCGVAKNARCAECACGTGNLTLPLSLMGYHMTGLDLSEEMLARAMEKAQKKGLALPFVKQDMAALSLPRRTDCLLATCDGVNYLTEPEKVQSFFAAAFRALRPGAPLIFDVSTPEKLSKTLGNNTLFSDEDEIAYIWQNHWNEEKKQVEMQLSIFVRQTDGHYLRFEEEQVQRAHSAEELTAWLQVAGFEDIAFFGELRMDAPRPGDERWHILARRSTK